MPTLPNREREIFDAALELTSAVARHDYLLGACRGDTKLRACVEALLLAHEQAGGFLATDDSRPSAAVPSNNLVAATGMFPVAEKAGDRIGRYKLRRRSAKADVA